MAFLIVMIILSVIWFGFSALIAESVENMEVSAMTTTLFNINRAARFADCECAGYALEWFVNTGRSTWQFDKALKRANPDKLVRFIGNDGDYHSAVKRAKQYLKRYCGLDKEA